MSHDEPSIYAGSPMSYIERRLSDGQIHVLIHWWRSRRYGYIDMLHGAHIMATNEELCEEFQFLRNVAEAKERMSPAYEDYADAEKMESK